MTKNKANMKQPKENLICSQQSPYQIQCKNMIWQISKTILWPALHSQRPPIVWLQSRKKMRNMITLFYLQNLFIHSKVRRCHHKIRNLRTQTRLKNLFAQKQHLLYQIVLIPFAYASLSVPVSKRFLVLCSVPPFFWYVKTLFFSTKSSRFSAVFIFSLSKGLIIF